MPSSPSTTTRPRSSRRLQPPARTSVKAMTRSGRRIASAIADDQLEHRHLARHADAEREAVETGTPVHVETVRTVAEEPVIGPARACEYGPIEPEADEAELAPVRVTRQRQVDVALGHVAEAERVVQQEQPEVTRAAREAIEQVADVLAPPLSHPVGAHDLDG